ncbi:partial Cyclic di-GMP phosphodiesterase, partial [Gammaproteobacteria bacterium]
LNKTGGLTPDEKAIINTHTNAGRDILMSSSRIYSGSVDVAHAHHENLDGSGYPRGLHGSQINLNSRIVSIVDKYAAITSPRPHRPMGDHLSAVAILNKLAREGKIDANITAAFISAMGVYPPGSIVELSNGEVGIVLESNTQYPLRPRLLVVRDANKNPCQCLIDMTQKTIDGRGRSYRIINVCSHGDYDISLSHYFELIVRAFN